MAGCRELEHDPTAWIFLHAMIEEVVVREVTICISPETGRPVEVAGAVGDQRSRRVRAAGAALEGIKNLLVACGRHRFCAVEHILGAFGVSAAA